MQLKSHRYDRFIYPIFDIEGSKEISPVSGGALQIHSPLDCVKPYPWILDPFVMSDESGQTGFPPERPGQPITCRTDLGGSTSTPFGSVPHTADFSSFEQYYRNGFPSESCTEHKLLLNGAAVKTDGSVCLDLVYEKTYEFVKVPSIVEHKSPTDAEYGAELKNFITPSLPADKNRYVDFIGAKGDYVAIAYPNLFRIKFAANEDINAETAKTKLKAALDAKSAEINAAINSQNPASLGGKDAQIYALLKTGPYPAANVDLYARIAENPVVLDSIVESVVWNNLDNATAKYGYLLEHHLDIDGNSSFPIAGHKGDYEIAYMVGKGDAANMYVKLDPEAQGGPPEEIATAMSRASELRNALDAANLSGQSGKEKAEFKCGPPDGVPLWQWLPAIFCWLSSILPPSVSSGSCSAAASTKETQGLIESIYGKKDSDNNGIPDYAEDLNKNGVVDSAERVGDGGSVSLSAHPRVASYFSNVSLSAKLLDRNGQQVLIDSTNEVSFEVDTIYAYSGSSEQLVYDRMEKEGEEGDASVISKYVTFSPVRVRAEAGEAKLGVSSMGLDADVHFVATVAPKDKNGVPLFSVSDDAVLKIRSDELVGTPYSGSGVGVSSMVAAGEFDRLEYRFERNSKNGSGAIAYPVSVTVTDADGTVVHTGSVASGNWTLSGDLLNRMGEYSIEFADAEGVSGIRSLTVSAGEAVSMELVPSSSAFVVGEKVTFLVRLLDKYGNYAKGDLVGMSGSISPEGK